jgi:outer membrane protein OmpA-like peptidoglycan-associated protein
VVGASTTRQPPLPPGSPYAQPADVPVNPAAPPGQMVNNQPVITPGFYGTQAPVAAAAPATQLNPTATTAPPPAAAGQNIATASPPDPTVAPRAQSVIQRDTLPPAAPPPPVPSDIAPVPSAPPPSPRPAPQQNLASLPPAAAPPSTSPSQLDEALHRTFPAAGPSSVGGAGIEALAATIYFRDGSAGMSPDDLTVVREVVRLHRERGGTVHVVGYASPDAAGGDVVAKRVANLELAGRRADAVSHELGRFGVAPGVITASAEGAPPPPDPGAAGFGAAAARRVDIYLAY